VSFAAAIAVGDHADAGDNRPFIEAVLQLVRTGAAGASCPRAWQGVLGVERFRRWALKGRVRAGFLQFQYFSPKLSKQILACFLQDKFANLMAFYRNNLII
jgi:hypothetical protein